MYTICKHVWVKSTSTSRAGVTHCMLFWRCYLHQRLCSLSNTTSTLCCSTALCPLHRHHRIHHISGPVKGKHDLECTSSQHMSYQSIRKGLRRLTVYCITQHAIPKSACKMLRRLRVVLLSITTLPHTPNKWA